MASFPVLLLLLRNPVICIFSLGQDLKRIPQRATPPAIHRSRPGISECSTLAQPTCWQGERKALCEWLWQEQNQPCCAFFFFGSSSSNSCHMHFLSGTRSGRTSEMSAPRAMSPVLPGIREWSTLAQPTKWQGERKQTEKERERERETERDRKKQRNLFKQNNETNKLGRQSIGDKQTQTQRAGHGVTETKRCGEPDAAI